MQIADLNRRNLLRTGIALVATPGLALLGLDHLVAQDTAGASEDSNKTISGTETVNTMQIRYLEFVTKDVDTVCSTYSKLYGLTFAEADPVLGGARTAALAGGTVLAVRGPLRDTEEPVVRPYVLVEDIKSAVEKAAELGAQVALPPMELPGHGTCAIVIQGGIEHGLWQESV